MIRFTGEAANQLRALEEDDHLITIALFAGLQFDGILSSFLASEGSLEQFYLNLVGTPEEALATELSGGTLNLAVSLFQVLQAYSVADNIANSTDDVYIVFPEYPHYETEIEEFYYTGVLFAADDLTGETLGDLSLWVDAVYYESLDVEVINPDGYSLGKANYEFPQGYVPVPNNYERNWLELKWVAP